MGWIYKITSPSGKSYIGQTVDDKVESRWAKEKNKPHGLLIHVFKKYGHENCKFEKLFEVSYRTHGYRWEEFLDFWEKFEIREQDTLRPRGYNSTSGGKNCYQVHTTVRKKLSIAQLNRPPMTDETRKKMSISRTGEKHHMYGKKHSKYSLEKMSKSQTGKHRGELNPNFGKAMSVDQKQLISETKKGANLIGEKAKNSKPIEQWSKNGTEFVRNWSNAREVTRELGLSYKNISSVCRGLRKTSGGFVWRWR